MTLTQHKARLRKESEGGLTEKQICSMAQVEQIAEVLQTFCAEYEDAYLASLAMIAHTVILQISGRVGNLEAKG